MLVKKIAETTSKEVALYQVLSSGLDIPESTFILKCPALEEILFNRNLVSGDLQKAALCSSKAFFEMFADKIQKYPSGQRVELVNLTGSLYYYLSGAHMKVFENPLFQNFVGIRRFPVKGYFDDNGRQVFETDICYTSFESEGKICFLGDTIATGISVADSLRMYLPWAQGHGLEELVIFSICGSKIGAERIHKICKEYQIPVTMVFGLGILGLGEDGTALTWNGHDKPITIDEYYTKANQTYSHGECAIGDWGLRNRNPFMYLLERKKEKLGI